MPSEHHETIRPYLLAAIPSMVVGTTILSAIVAGLAWLFVARVDASLAKLLFVAGAVLLSVLGVGNLRTQEYHFYDDHVAIHTGFLNVTRENVPYSRVTDVGLTESVWQRLFGVGTVTVDTAGSDGTAIRLSHVKRPETVYDAVQSLIG